MVPGFRSQASCISLPRRSTNLAVSETSRTPAAARAVYSPRLWPAMTTGAGIAESSSCSSIALMQARLTAMMAGWAFTVCFSSSSGPRNSISVRGRPSASSTCSNTSRAAGDCSYSSRPIPTAWAPWPGNRKAALVPRDLGIKLSVMVAPAA